MVEPRSGQTERSDVTMTRRTVAAVVRLSPDDVDVIEALRAESNETLGFLAKPVMSDYLEKGGGFGIRDANGLVAYCLFARHRRHIRIIHLCVAPLDRGAGHARRLVDAVVDEAKNGRIGVVKLNCRRDFPAHSMWPELGFVALAEKEAKTPGESLITWCRAVAGEEQKDIFSVLVSDDRTNAVIDAQLVFQLDSPDDSVAKGLQADFLSDLLVLHIVDETFNEIDRGKSREQRRRSRNFAHTFPRVQYDVDRVSVIERDLKRILPSSTPSQRSDIRQIAITADSNVNIFLTRDERLLAKAAEIKRLTSLDVLHPYKLIVRLDEFADRESYSPIPVSGMNLAWRKVGEVEATEIPPGALLGDHERKGGFKANLDAALSNPHVWRTEGLWSERALVALRSMRYDEARGRLVVGLCRACRGAARSLFTEYTIASVVVEAVNKGYPMVELGSDSTTPEAVDTAIRLGFVETGEGLIRDCPAQVMSSSTLRAIVHPRHAGASTTNLEKACSPVALEDSDLPCFMVPIKPGYARSLFDTNLAADDLLGTENSVLLGLENAYFRKCSHRHMMRAPARILWYVSDRIGVVAISHLNEIRIGSPKDMFREHKQIGTLGWPEIREMCGGDKLQTIMVLQFSNTFLFRWPVDFRSLKRLFAKHSNGLVVQSPSRVPKGVFLDIYHLGFRRTSAT